MNKLDKFIEKFTDSINIIGIIDPNMWDLDEEVVVLSS